MRLVLTMVAALAVATSSAAFGQTPQPAQAPAPAPARPRVGPVGVAPPIQPDARSREIIEARNAKLEALSGVTDAALKAPPAADWLNWRRTYDAHAFSPLDQINRDNVGRLQTAWAWSLSNGTNQITPIVHDGVMFVYSAGDHVQAIDAANGEVLWWYDRPLPAGASAGAPQIHRNMAIWGDKLFFASDDKHLVALNIKTGKVAWDKSLGAGQYRLTSGPLVANGKVIQGTSTCLAGGCDIVGMDAETGAELWRFKTVASSNQPGGDTWNGLPDDQRFGASVWLSGSYDAELNLVYFGTGNTYHWQELTKGGPNKTRKTTSDGLYINSTLALNPDTGKLAWAFPHMPGEPWDLDFAFERTVMMAPVNGKLTKVVCTTGKMVWTDCVDAATGKFAFSHDAGLQNVIKSQDPKTGRKTYFPEALPDLTGQRRNLQCSAGYGDKNWPAGSFDAATGLTFSSLVEVCGESAPTMFGPNDKAYTGGQETRIARYQPGSDGNIGRLDAVNWATGKTLWSVRQRASMVSAVVATKGGVLFAGDSDRWFRAYDQATGKVLWQVRLNEVVNSYPITFSAGGKQYVAVSTGCCGNGRLLNMQQLTPEIVRPRGNSSVMWVFALPAGL